MKEKSCGKTDNAILFALEMIMQMNSAEKSIWRKDGAKM